MRHMSILHLLLTLPCSIRLGGTPSIRQRHVLPKAKPAKPTVTLAIGGPLPLSPAPEMGGRRQRRRFRESARIWGVPTSRNLAENRFKITFFGRQSLLRNAVNSNVFAIFVFFGMEDAKYEFDNIYGVLCMQIFRDAVNTNVFEEVAQKH